MRWHFLRSTMISIADLVDPMACNEALLIASEYCVFENYCDNILLIDDEACQRCVFVIMWSHHLRN